MQDEFRATARSRALKVALAYGVIAGAYILASSLLLGTADVGRKAHAAIEALKGLGFVAVTGAALGIVIFRDYSAILDAKAEAAAAATALARAQSAASLSVVTGAVAHDMRNLLAAAMTSLEFVVPGSDADADSDEALEDLRESLGRLSTLARDLLERSSRPSGYPPSDLDVAEVVGGCVRLTPLFARGHRCRFETSYGDGCVVRARRQELECAVLNLLLNAIDANGRKGGIAVRVARSADRVVITVRDEGPGVPEELRGRIFEPFFTTKGERGNGVGLAVTRGLVRSYGGDVRLSDAGPGAEFEVALPAAG